MIDILISKRFMAEKNRCFYRDDNNSLIWHNQQKQNGVHHAYNTYGVRRMAKQKLVNSVYKFVIFLWFY